MATEFHPIPPVYDENSRVLILGSFPSVKSREEAFFYGHPQNRFWRVLAAIFARPLLETVEDKKAFLLENKIALWDVISQCDIEGSADSGIKNVIPNDIGCILEKGKIEKIFLNGKTALKYYNKYLKEKVSIEALCLPSTSPANAAWSLERLISAWKEIK